MKRLLGIDFGEKRIGIAISDENQKIAMPHAVLPNDRMLYGEIQKMCKGFKISAIIIGESKDFKGNDNPIMQKIKVFKQELERDLKLPVYFEPEFMTSAQAKHLQGDSPLLDASAAALILQSYIDRKK